METANQAVETQPQATETAASQTEQKDAVFNLALQALNGQTATEGQPLKSLVTKEVRKAIRVGLYEGIKNGSIKYSKTGKSDGQLKKYCSSLINNWLKKDSRFNS